MPSKTWKIGLVTGLLLLLTNRGLAKAKDEFDGLLPSLCGVLIEGAGPVRWSQLQGLVPIQEGLYVLGNGAAIRHWELVSTIRYVNWLHTQGRRETILLLPEIGWPIPAFDGIIFSESGEALANFSLKSALKASYIGNTEEVQLSDDPDQALDLMEVATTDIMSFSTAARWMGHLQDPLAYRVITTLFGVPLAVKGRKTRIIIDLGSEASTFDVLEGSESQIERAILKATPLVKEITFLNGKTTQSFLNPYTN